MAQFVAYDKRVEVSGEVVLSIIKGVELFRKDAYQILRAHGIDYLDAGKWFPLQNFLEAFKFISDKLGNDILFVIGKMIPQNAKWPPQIKTLDEALPSIDVAYHLNHRIGSVVMVDSKLGIMKKGIGSYRYERTGLRCAAMICDNPYPCDFDRGIIETVVYKYKPKDSNIFLVRHVPNQPCRKKGGNSCTYSIGW